MTDSPVAPPQPPAAPTPPAATDASPAVPVPPAAPEKRRRALGVWAFVLGLLAVLNHIAIVVVGAIAIGFALTGFGAGPEGLLDALAGGAAAVAGFVFFAFISFWSALGLAVLSILLGIIGIIRRSGRAFAVVGIVFSAGVIGVSLLIVNAVGAVPDLFSGSF